MGSSDLSNFSIVGMTEDRWAQYVSWWTVRGILPPAWTSDAIFVATEPGACLVAGALIFPTESEYAVVEHVAVNPSVPPRVAHAAVVFGAHALRIYGVMRNKWMLCFPVNRGLEGALRRGGFVLTGKVMKQGM